MSEKSERTTTGVVGLDESLLGGYPKGKVILEGPSSDERNAFALSFAADGLKNGEYVMIVTSTMSPTKVRKVLRKLGPNVKSQERKGKLVIVDWYSHNTTTVDKIEERGSVIKCPEDTFNLNEAIRKAHSRFPKGSKHRAVIEGLSSIINKHDMDTALLVANSLKSTFGDEHSTVLFVVDSEMHDESSISTLVREFDGRIELKRTKGKGAVIGEISVHSMRDVEHPSNDLVLEKADDGSLRIVVPDANVEEPSSSGGISELIDSLRKDSSNETTWFELGTHYTSLNNDDRAHECFDAALKIRPGFIAAWIAKANLHAERGKNNQALRCYRKALDLDSDRKDDDKPDKSEDESAWRETECPECGSSVSPTDPFCLSCGSDLPTKIKKDKEGPIKAALEKCQKRIEKNPDDVDALFLKGLCLARLERYEEAVVALNDATKLNFEYPGLWVVKGKVYSRLGNEKMASLSLQRGIELARRDTDKIGLTFECSNCGEDVKVREDQCSNCGARFKAPGVGSEVKGVEKPPELSGNLLSVVSKWESGLTEIGAPKDKEKRVEPRDKPKTTVVKMKAVRTEAGLTNGLTREVREAKLSQRVDQPIGRGRTNGLTNGLTNGVRGRTNGLTVEPRTDAGETDTDRIHGLDREIGVTNGLGRDISSTRVSLTDGLTNGNGLTNGLGAGRFRQETTLARWKIYLVPLIAFALLVTPLFYVSGPSIADSVTIDGEFTDWDRLPVTSMNPSSLDPNIDIIGASVEMSGEFVYFYIEVLGNLLQGNTLTDTGDVVHILIDSDRNSSTGYGVRGLGADLYVEITGVNRAVHRSHLWEFPAGGNADDWNDRVMVDKALVAVASGEMEVRVDRGHLGADVDSILVLFNTLSWIGDEDYSDFVLSETGGVLSALQESAIATETVSGVDQNLLNVELIAINDQVTLTSLEIEVSGSALPSDIASLELVDSANQMLDQTLFLGNPVTFEFDPVNIEEGTFTVLTVRADLTSGSGKTVGAMIPSSSSLGVGDDAATPVYYSSMYDLGYIESVPQQVTIDGGFVDWANCTNVDESLEASILGDSDIDIGCYDGLVSQGNLFAYFDVSGKILAGTNIPRLPPTIRSLAPSPVVDSDKDTVPDQYDLNPYDYDNDGTPDVQTYNDVDGDSVIDYPFGSDYWLNTTIPLGYPPAYAGRDVTRYIGPVEKPPVIGEDVARIFIDADNSTSTGYPVQGTGSDYMLEIRGTSGRLLSVGLMEFNGGYLGEWKWILVGTDVDIAFDSHRLEASFDVTSLQLQPDFVLVFVTGNWKGGSDITNEALSRGLPNDGTRHFADANGGYGLVAPDGGTIDITIDGTIDEASETDWTSIAKTDTYGSYIKTYAVYNSTDLFVAVEVIANGTGEGAADDYAEIAFDTDHDGDTDPGTDDYKFKIRDPVGTPVTSEAQGDGSTWDETWSPGTAWSGSAADTDTYVTFEFRIPLEYVFGTSTPSDGDIGGFCVHMFKENLTTYYYWPDATGSGSESNGREDNSSQWGDLFYTRPRLVINEVSPLTSPEWVELYNGGDSIEINGTVLSDQDGFSWTMSSSLVVPNNVYLILMSGSGTDDTDLLDGNGTIYIGTTEFTDAGDDVLLKYGGNDMGFDYMQYGSGGDVNSCPADAASENTWSGTLTAPSGSDSAGRDKSSSDTNSSGDWDNTGGPDVSQRTRGHVNYLASLTVTGADKAPASVEQGENPVVMLQLTMSADYGWIEVTGLDVNRTGTSSTQADISEATIWEDVDGDGEFDSGTDTFLASGTYDDTYYSFSGFSFNVQSGTSTKMLVVYNISTTANTGVTVGARIDGESNVTIAVFDTVASFSAIQSTNSTINGNELLVYGGDIAPAVAFRSEDSIEILNITLSVEYGSVTVTQIDVTLTGTGSNSDIDEAVLYDDVNDDGDYDAGTDTFLATGTYSSGVYSFSSLSVTVSAGTDENLLVMYNISATATLENTVGGKINDENDITVQSPDSVATLSSISSSNVLIRYSDIFVIEVTGEVYESTDGGKTFSNPGDAGANIVAICANRSNTDIYAFEDSGEVYLSTDKGQTWNLRGDAFSGAASGIDMTIDNNDVIYIIRSTGVAYSSSDGGATFTTRADAGNQIAGIEANYSNNDLYVVDAAGAIFFSSDSGDTWSSRGDASAGNDVKDIAIDTAGYVYVLEGSGEIYRSTDYGDTFSQRSDIGDLTYVGLTIDYSYNYIYVVADDGSVYLSTNTGTNWMLRSDIGTETDYEDITCVIIPELPQFALILLGVMALLMLVRLISNRRFDVAKSLRQEKIGSSAAKNLFTSVITEIEHESGKVIRKLGLTSAFEGGSNNA
jgi:KaiC/GvpD/RAD55 family RecA-like ATPase/photosystem II stability/assembly factor-like uncharacterized protein